MNVAHQYEAFVHSRTQLGGEHGFAPTAIPREAKDFQVSLIEWACRQGRSALFADCGLGKTLMQLAWADNVVRHTNRSVLILTPLAVASQTVREGEKFGIEVLRGEVGKVGIYVANYERLHHYNPDDFVGCVCDESSILKNFKGATRNAITVFMRKMPYRLLCTATAAPNDYVELGTSSEALGHLGNVDMINRFFTNRQRNSFQGRAWAGHGGEESLKLRLKGHAEDAFWKWVCSWSRSMRKPSDLGFSDDGYALPDLIESEHMVSAIRPRAGWLFSEPARGLAEQREERRRTLNERCEMAAQLVSEVDEPAIVWCYLNDESEACARLVSDAVEVSGKDTDESKEEKFEAFARGDAQARVLVIKPVIGAWGLNWQHCAFMTMFAGYSFEQYYQSVRRCWRFGQQRSVRVAHVLSDGEGDVLAARTRKARAADDMFASIVTHMRNAIGVDAVKYEVLNPEVPAWLCSNR